MNNLCSSNVIQAYLDETIDRESEENLLEHLETCAACQAKLSETAASQELWDSVQTHLLDQAHDLTQVSHPDVEDATAGDFGIRSILSILKPTDLPQMLGRLGPYEISGVIGAGG
ncbi:MAG: zf-HC2 domain-containing protein, partial [Planctomycetota bacterium]